MKHRYPFEKKSYAMRRMAVAIERAILGHTPEQKERAALWAAAWGRYCGITTKLGPQYVIPAPPNSELMQPLQMTSSPAKPGAEPS
jgi:hypothetical protein